MALILEEDRIVLFGKIPAEGDFVRVNADFREVYWFDQWLQQGIALSKEVHRESWDSLYDSVRAMNFVMHTGSSEGILVGTLVPSKDKGNRRYPLWTGVIVESHALSGREIALLPSAFRLFFEEAEVELTAARSLTDPKMLENIAAGLRKLVPRDLHSGDYMRFVESETIGGFSTRCTGDPSATKRAALFLGLSNLLSPMRGLDLTKWGLVLRYPLGDVASHANAVSYWLQCTLTMLGEPGMMPFLAWANGTGAPSLFLTFRQPPPRLLSQILGRDGDGEAVFRVDRDGEAPEGGTEHALRSVLGRDDATLNELLRVLL
jgi:type VI secretion system protein ImpM